MKKILLILFALLFISSFSQSFSQVHGKKFGFGIVLGEPTGGTVKFWTQTNNAFVVDLGASYFGSPRIGVDYLWHFDAFHSNIAKLYAGPGAALGIGEGNGFWYKGKKEGIYYHSGVGLGIRGVFGVNVVPDETPLEFFFEIGALIGLAPDFGSGIDAALGLRFYP